MRAANSSALPLLASTLRALALSSTAGDVQRRRRRERGRSSASTWNKSNAGQIVRAMANGRMRISVTRPDGVKRFDVEVDHRRDRPHPDW